MKLLTQKSQKSTGVSDDYKYFNQNEADYVSY